VYQNNYNGCGERNEYKRDLQISGDVKTWLLAPVVAVVVRELKLTEAGKI
jgi:hypothetical protein